MISEPPFLWPPIKRYSLSFFGVPFDGRPTLANHTANTVFPLFLWRSFRRPPISGRSHRQFFRQLLPEPIAPPPRPLSAKRATKSGVLALDQWICAILAHSRVSHAPHSFPNERSDALSPDLKRSPTSKLSRAHTRVQKDLPVCRQKLSEELAAQSVGDGRPPDGAPKEEREYRIGSTIGQSMLNILLNIL
jgi:hypothetical protein